MDRKYMDMPLELKGVSDEGVFSGYASTFLGTPDSKGDIIMPGCFTKTLEKNGRNKTGIVLLWQHDPAEPIGVWTELVQDSKGLKVTGRLILSTPGGRKAYELLRAGAIKHLSIGFEIIDFEIDRKKKVRYLKAVDLWEISLVSFPALLSAQVTNIKSETDLTGELLKLGLSVADAQHIPSLCTVCSNVGGLPAKKVKAIAEYLKSYSQDVISNVVLTAEQYTCFGKAEVSESGWSDILGSVKAVASDILALETEAKNSLEELQKKVASKVDMGAVGFEEVYRIIDQANLKISTTKSLSDMLMPDFKEKMNSHVIERLDSIEGKLRKRQVSSYSQDEEETPRRKPLSAQENYERNGVFRADWDYDPPGPSNIKIGGSSRQSGASSFGSISR